MYQKNHPIEIKTASISCVPTPFLAQHFLRYGGMRTSFELSRRWRWILLLFSVIFKANNPDPALFLALSVGVFLVLFFILCHDFLKQDKKREGFGELNAFSHDPWYFDLSHFYVGIYFRVPICSVWRGFRIIWIHRRTDGIWFCDFKAFIWAHFYFR